jgi:hypothetical protein
MKIQPLTNWQEAARACLHVLDNPTPEGKKYAYEVIMKMAKAFDDTIAQRRESFEQRNMQGVNQ